MNEEHTDDDPHRSIRAGGLGGRSRVLPPGARLMAKSRPTSRRARKPSPRRARPAAAPSALPQGDDTGGSAPAAMLLGYLPKSHSAPDPAPQRGRAPSPAKPVPEAAEGSVDPSLRAQVTAMSCAAVQDLEPQGLGVTYWFQARPSGEPYDVEVHFSGTQPAGGAGAAPAAFTASRTLPHVLPGVGKMAFTARFNDVAPGPWHVTASARETAAGRTAASSGVTADGRTGFLPVIRELAPGVHPGSWPATVALGAVLAIGSLLMLATRYGIPAWPTLGLALVACVVGLAGAKVYFNLQSRERTSLLSTSGLCIQGFVLAAFATVIAGSALLGLPTASLLDIAAPGLMLGVLLGRIGCWAGGCCAGRPSTSRLALWSSDRTVGVKRIPVQLIEGLAAAAIGTVALVLAWRSLPSPPGALFVAVIAAYVFTRQLLFPLRSLARRTRQGRYIALVIAAVALVASITLLALPVS